MQKLNTIYKIDAIQGLKRLDDESIDCVMTSPPYWTARNYGIPETKWSDGSRCMLGLEPTCDQYVSHLLDIFKDILRVLKPSGTLWVNISDTYAGSWRGNRYNRSVSLQKNAKKPKEKCRTLSDNISSFYTPSTNKQPVQKKSMCLIPERFMLGMMNQGWILRNKIVWHKTNHLPASVKDRLTSSWEYLLFFVKRQKYAFDIDSVRIPHQSPPRDRRAKTSTQIKRPSPNPMGRRLPPKLGESQSQHPLGKNPSDFWPIATCASQPIKALSKIKINTQSNTFTKGSATDVYRSQSKHTAMYPEQLCERPIKSGCPVGGVVLDPFMGSGTTAVVARRLGRNFIGFELNPSYVQLARTRLQLMNQQLKGGRSIHNKNGTT